MNNKKGLVATLLLIVLVLLILVLGYLIFHFYFDVSSTGGQDQKTPNSGETLSNCGGIADNYPLPDFNRLKEILANQQLIKDSPSNGKISLEFYHFVGDCRKFDKIFLVSGGKIKEENTKADIIISIKSDYADRITADNLCEIIHQARANGDLGQSVNIGTTKLMWVYNGMLKYRDCLGL